MGPLLRLVRVGNVAVSFVGTVAGGLAAAGGGFGLGPSAGGLLLLAAGSTSCVTAGGNVLNDLLDRESDRTNHPDRPLVTGAVSERSARLLVYGLFAAAIALAVPVTLRWPAVGILLGLAIAALLSYEFLAKARGLSGNALVAGLTGAVFLYGGAALGSWAPVLPFAGLAVLATFSREIIKDMEDVQGDVERRSFPRTHGLPASALLARIAVLAAIALSPLPALTLLSGRLGSEIIYLALVSAADAGFVASVLWLPDRLHREQTLSKGAMSLALLAILATAFR